MKNKLKKFKAVLFDMDGVIVDSMPYHFISWFEAMRKYNVRIAPSDIFAMEGAKWDKVIRYAFNRDSLTLTKKTLHTIFLDRQRLFAKYFKRYIFPEIIEIIKLLKNQGFLIGLVTGSSLAEAKKMLPKNIYILFDAKVSGDMVKRGKPHPDSYLLAAKTAGMYCAAIATSLSKEYLKKADKIYASHKELYADFKK